MIAVTCGSCRHEFEVPDIRAGVEVMCPPCGERIRVPRPEESASGFASESAGELIGAHAQAAVQHEGTSSRSRDRSDDTDRRYWSPNRVTTVEYEEEVAAEDWDDGSRNFAPDLEHEERSRRLLRIGQAMTIAFLLPVLGAPGRALWFPQFSEFPGMNLAGVLLLLPLLVGFTMMAIARRVELPLRGILAIACGLSMLGVMLLGRDARTMMSGMVSAMPTSVSVSSLLFVLALVGLVVSTRVRWYRPLHRAAYPIGAAAAACYVLYLFIPANGSMPIKAPFAAFDASVLVGLGLLAHVGLVATAGVLCAMNTPSTLASDATAKANRAFLCLIGSVVIPVLAVTLAAMFMSSSMRMPGASMGSPATFFLSAAVKFGVMYGGLALLIPVGVADLLIGRAESE